MRPLLPRVFSAILEDCDVLETRIAFEVRDTKSTSLKRKADLFVGFVGEPANVVRRVHEHFMSAYRSHAVVNPFRRAQGISLDRKSTRLNSSHPSISYAVFCLKKKKKSRKNKINQ